jgi:hypothetical protein
MNKLEVREVKRQVWDWIHVVREAKHWKLSSETLGELFRESFITHPWSFKAVGLRNCEAGSSKCKHCQVRQSSTQGMPGNIEDSVRSGSATDVLESTDNRATHAFPKLVKAGVHFAALAFLIGGWGTLPSLKVGDPILHIVTTTESHQAASLIPQLSNDYSQRIE